MLFVSRQKHRAQGALLQALGDVSNNGKSSTIVFPLPLDLIRPLMEAFSVATRSD